MLSVASMSDLPTIRVPSNLSGPAFKADGFMSDGLINFVSRMGTVSDKSTHLHYAMRMFDQMDAEAAYRTSWFRKICDIIPFDEVREWRTWGGIDSKQVTVVLDEENRLGYRQKVKEARTLARKDGGAAIFIGTGGNAASELKPDDVGKGGLKYLTVLNRYEIQPGEQQRDPRETNFGEPKLYRLATGISGSFEIHPSRIIRFIGNPIRMNGVWDGWGDSIWTELRQSIKHSDQIAAAVAGLVEEAKLDIVRIKNLANNLSTQAGEDLLFRRWAAVNSLKSIMNALMLDADDEYEQKTLAFQGIMDIQTLALMIMSGMADIPATRLLGRSPQGMNATGESDMRNYYDRIRAGQQVDLGPKLAPLDRMLVQSALGTRPEGIYYSWSPLYQLTEKEAADVEKVYAETTQIYANNGVMPDQALADIVKNGIIERGQFPGAQKAFEEAPDDPPLLAEPTEAELAEEEARVATAKQIAKDPAAATSPKPRLVANDARPRTLYVSRAVMNTAEIKKWAKGQGFKSTVDDMHVTIAMSSAPLDWMKIPATWSWGDKEGEVVIQPGGARIVEPLGDKGAVVLLFTSSELSWRHTAIREAGATWDFPDYQPHVTLTYEGKTLDLDKIEPYRGEIVLGPEIWEETKPVGTIEHEES